MAASIGGVVAILIPKIKVSMLGRESSVTEQLVNSRISGGVQICTEDHLQESNSITPAMES